MSTLLTYSMKERYANISLFESVKEVRIEVVGKKNKEGGEEGT